MKTYVLSLCLAGLLCTHCTDQADKADARTAGTSPAKGKNMYMDVHDLPPGEVRFQDVMAAHQKDLATQGKYEVRFIKFWVDEAKGKVYCLSEAGDSNQVIRTHKEAHGLLPSSVMQVKEGE